MKLNSEGDGSVDGGFRILQLPPPESTVTNHGGLGGRIEAERIYGTAGATKFMKIVEEDCDSSWSSSIGKNSDDDDDDDQEGDAQSAYRYDAIQDLEEALPIRRGISTFYNGHSKSFTSLTEKWATSTPSIQEIVKPINPYARKRRNILAKNKKHVNMGRITKKTKSSMRSISMVHLHRCGSRSIQKC